MPHCLVMEVRAKFKETVSPAIGLLTYIARMNLTMNLTR